MGPWRRRLDKTRRAGVVLAGAAVLVLLASKPAAASLWALALAGAAVWGHGWRVGASAHGTVVRRLAEAAWNVRRGLGWVALFAVFSLVHSLAAWGWLAASGDGLALTVVFALTLGMLVGVVHPVPRPVEGVPRVDLLQGAVAGGLPVVLLRLAMAAGESTWPVNGWRQFAEYVLVAAVLGALGRWLTTPAVVAERRTPWLRVVDADRRELLLPAWGHRAPGRLFGRLVLIGLLLPVGILAAIAPVLVGFGPSTAAFAGIGLTAIELASAAVWMPTSTRVVVRPQSVQVERRWMGRVWSRAQVDAHALTMRMVAVGATPWLEVGDGVVVPADVAPEPLRRVLAELRRDLIQEEDADAVLANEALGRRPLRPSPSVGMPWLMRADAILALIVAVVGGVLLVGQGPLLPADLYLEYGVRVPLGLVVGLCVLRAGWAYWRWRSILAQTAGTVRPVEAAVDARPPQDHRVRESM